MAFSILCIGLLSIGADSALHFHDAPIDGPFQLFNAKTPHSLLIGVELTYDARNSLSPLPVIGAEPRYLVVSSGAGPWAPQTLDPHTATTRFPLIATEDAHVGLDFKTNSLIPGVGADVASVPASQYHVTRSIYPWMYNFAMAASPPPVIYK
jgi:hypothetical protein